MLSKKNSEKFSDRIKFQQRFAQQIIITKHEGENNEKQNS